MLIHMLFWVHPGKRTNGLYRINYQWDKKNCIELWPIVVCHSRVIPINSMYGLESSRNNCTVRINVFILGNVDVSISCKNKNSFPKKPVFRSYLIVILLSLNPTLKNKMKHSVHVFFSFPNCFLVWQHLCKKSFSSSKLIWIEGIPPEFITCWQFR